MTALGRVRASSFSRKMSLILSQKMRLPSAYFSISALTRSFFWRAASFLSAPRGKMARRRILACGSDFWRVLRIFSLSGGKTDSWVIRACVDTQSASALEASHLQNYLVPLGLIDLFNSCAKSAFAYLTQSTRKHSCIKSHSAPSVLSDYIANTVQNVFGLIGEHTYIIHGRNTAEHQHSVYVGLDTRDYIRVHSVAYKRNVTTVAAQHAQAMTQHQRVRLAHEIGLFAGCDLDGGYQGSCGGHDASRGDTDGIGVGADQLGALIDQSDSFFNLL